MISVGLLGIFSSVGCLVIKVAEIIVGLCLCLVNRKYNFLQIIHLGTLIVVSPDIGGEN